jgi:phosphoribosylanthranilate isomerase
MALGLSMKLDIKICGLKSEEAVAAALEGGASHIGFIFFPPSPRNVAPETAFRLRSAARGRALAVAVTVDADDRLLDRLVATVEPDMLQLHGKEAPERVVQLRERHGLPIIKALAISSAADLERVAHYYAIADRLLLDARPPKGATLPGGNGVSFDWRLLAGLDPGLDYMLSGGLNAANIATALALTAPTGIDVSSGVETAPGVKDPALVRGFLEATRAALAAHPDRPPASARRLA